MEVNYIAYVFLMLAGAMNGLMDLLQFRFKLSLFCGLKDWFYDPRISWHNKWKNGDPANGEEFLGSSTIFVFLTDAWHLFQWLMISFIALSVVTYAPQSNLAYTFVEFIFVRFICWQIGFWITFESKLFKVL